jgi:hypothetical protein
MIAGILFAAEAMAMSPYRPLPAEELAAVRPARAEQVGITANKKRQPCDSVEGVAKLPYAHGHRFCSLDEYLSHLERNAAPIDQPWWRPIRPGVYEHVKRMTGAKPEIATRAELMKRFGFSK